jgi:hypothetical protein
MNTAAQEFLDGFAEMRELQKLALLAQIEHQRLVRRRLVIATILGFAFLAVVLAALHSSDAAVFTVAAELAIVLVALLALGVRWLWRRISWREIGTTALMLAIAFGVTWMRRNLPATPVEPESTASSLPPGFVLDTPAAVNSSNQMPAFDKGGTRKTSTGCIITFSTGMAKETINKVLREMAPNDCPGRWRAAEFGKSLQMFPGDVSDADIATAFSIWLRDGEQVRAAASGR